MLNANDTLMKINNPIRHVDSKDFHKLLVDDICVFCSPPSEKVFFENDNFYVTYDSSPLKEGHLLIHTKEHLGCTGEVPDDIYTELVEIKDQIGRMLTDIYGAVSFYEHGRAGHCSIMIGDTICHHLHVHALPITEKIDEVMSKRFKSFQVDDLHSIPSLYEQYGPYLFFENSDGKQFFFPVKDDLEEHYLRTIISEALGTPERASYKDYTNLGEINNFITKAKSYLDV